jgi:hypothetical protein
MLKVGQVIRIPDLVVDPESLYLDNDGVARPLEVIGGDYVVARRHMSVLGEVTVGFFLKYRNWTPDDPNFIAEFTQDEVLGGFKSYLP